MVMFSTVDSLLDVERPFVDEFISDVVVWNNAGC